MPRTPRYHEPLSPYLGPSKAAELGIPATTPVVEQTQPWQPPRRPTVRRSLVIEAK
jgi:hypothetical protein